MITEQAKQAAVTLLHLLDKQVSMDDGRGRRPLREAIGCNDEVELLWTAMKDNSADDFEVACEELLDRLEAGRGLNHDETTVCEMWDYEVPGFESAVFSLRKLLKASV